MYKDESLNPPALACTVGKTELRYEASLPRRPARDAEETWGLDATGQCRRAEAGGRRHSRGLGSIAGNPAGGWYGLKKGLRGRFGMYVPPLMEALGLAEVEHNAKSNRMRAI